MALISYLVYSSYCSSYCLTIFDTSKEESLNEDLLLLDSAIFSSTLFIGNCLISFDVRSPATSSYGHTILNLSSPCGIISV